MIIHWCTCIQHCIFKCNLCCEGWCQHNRSGWMLKWFLTKGTCWRLPLKSSMFTKLALACYASYDYGVGHWSPRKYCMKDDSCKESWSFMCVGFQCKCNIIGITFSLQMFHMDWCIYDSFPFKHIFFFCSFFYQIGEANDIFRILPWSIPKIMCSFVVIQKFFIIGVQPIPFVLAHFFVF